MLQWRKGGMGKERKEEGRIIGKAEQGWRKGGNCVIPYLLVTEQQRLKRTNRSYPSTSWDCKSHKKSVSGALISGIITMGCYSTAGLLCMYSGSTINLLCQDNGDNPRSHTFLWSTVRNEILWRSGSSVLISIHIFLIPFLWSPKQSNLFPKIPLQTCSSHTAVLSSNKYKKGEKNPSYKD